MAKRRGPPWRVIAVVFTGVTVAAMTAALFSGAGVEAPRDLGVCYRMSQGVDGKVKFAPLARDISNLETCAAYLERVHLNGASEVDGSYQGRFIFIDEDAIRASARLDGSRWRIFFQPQRVALDRKLKEGGKTLNVVTSPASTAF